MQTVTELGPALGIAPTCRALDISRGSYYRRRTPRRPPSRRASPRALSAGERRVVIETLHERRFADLAPAQVHVCMANC